MDQPHYQKCCYFGLEKDNKKKIMLHNVQLEAEGSYDESY